MGKIVLAIAIAAIILASVPVALYFSTGTMAQPLVVACVLGGACLEIMA